MIMRTLRVKSIPAEVLFDSGASHSFISRPFYEMHDLMPELLAKPLSIISSGKIMNSRLIVPNVSIKMGNYVFLVSPIVLGKSDIDLILGMDWLLKHKDFLDCGTKEIKLIHPSEDVIIFALVMTPFGCSLSTRKARSTLFLRFQLSASMNMSFLKSFQVCLLNGQSSSLLILSLI